MNFGAIEYYEILRFDTATYNDPDHIPIDLGLDSEFRDYLQRDNSDSSKNNGTGEDLYSLVGDHLLIHDDQNACDEDSGGYAPIGAGGEGSPTTSFTDGLVSWSPVCDSNSSLTRCAANQEAMHQFISESENDPYTGSDDDEHSLGKVIDNGSSAPVTPLLAYHWDDSEVGAGDCPSETSFPSTHTVSPTECTKKAIRDTADAEVPENLQ
ncbi:MAG: hypothetical protein ABEI75_01685 [Halobaculum sp.]